MEVVRRWFYRCADAFGDFMDEAAFRAMLAFDVLCGKLPRQVERRWWNRAIETPVLIDTFDWTDDRLLFSVIVWPPLESPGHDAIHDHEERVREVLEAIARGAADKRWSTRFETDYGLRWDHKRQVWTAEDGFSYSLPERIAGGRG